MIARLARSNQSGAFRLSERIEDLDPLPRRPQNVRLRFAVKERNGCGVMRVATAFVGQPPRSVRVNRHFLSERRNATPSNFGAWLSPTARFSARHFVMHKRAGRVRRSLVMPLEGKAVFFLRNNAFCRAARQASPEKILLRHHNLQRLPPFMRRIFFRFDGATRSRRLQ